MSWRRSALPILAWGALLAAGALALDWVGYQRLVRAHASDLYLFVVAAAFLIVGLVVGMKVLAAKPRADFDGNPQAVASLGISAREREVLELLAAGHANKEIADRLGVSPHTVKTHVARLLEKLEAKRRTDAIARARALGILR
ncbi:response regulator transcription factor [Sphingoaurantiacus capsulatus]|uniref:Response regulator transcription factor n=1 Tax=Sphingoaurantiacus capsulatus TaxID=1771310 RepID=A0ABV7XAS0_9SPHN